MAAHPVHVSITNLDVNYEKKTIFISQKMYTEDFSLLFYHLYEKNIKFEAGKDLSPAELAIINGYMTDALVLESGKTKLPMEFVRKEQDNESIWLYYTCPLPSNKIKSLVLTNSVMLDLFEDQTNLVIVTHNGVDTGYTFNYNSWKSEINLQHQ
jgi:hypothetical protein